MYYITWYLLLLFGFTASEELTPNVTIILEEKGQYLKYDPPILFDNEPFGIIVESSMFNNSDSEEVSIMCSYSYNNQSAFIEETLKNVGGRYIVNVTKANRKMSTPWYCIINRKTNIIYNNTLSITVHIRLLEIQGGMRVNDQNIDLQVTNLTASNYDSVGTYYYRDGELAKITCYFTNENYNFQTLLFNVSDTKHKSGSDKDMNLYLKLGHKRSPKYIDCVLKNNLLGNKYIKRLMFERLTDEIDYPQFYVNGLLLTPSKPDHDHKYVFVYEYYSGENLIVKNKNSSRFISMNCTASNLTIDNSNDISELELNIGSHQFVYPQASVDCLIKQRNDNMPVSISLKFIEDISIDTMKFSPNIRGIQWSKIIAKFKNDFNNSYYEDTYYASYNSNDNMTILNCSSNKTGVKWINDTEVSTLLSAEKFIKSTNEFISSRTFQLPENVNETVLKCTCDGRTSKVILIKEEKMTSTKDSDNSKKDTNVLNFDATTQNNLGDDRENSGIFSGSFLYIVIGVVSIFIIIFIITLIVSNCKQKKLLKSDSDINYENLPAHNEGSMPTPSQWDTNRHKNENIEVLYAKAIPKSQRAKVTDIIYSEPLSNTEDTCYATPYNASLESPYAEIIPKCKRNKNDPSTSADIDCYAQVVPKWLRNENNQVLPTNENCAESGTKLENRMDSDNLNYANVFISNSGTYANVNFPGASNVP